MSTSHLVDPEFREFFENFPIHDFNDEAMPAMRQMMLSTLGELGEVPASVIREQIIAPGVDGSPDVACYLYRPSDVKQPVPAYLHLHGGGMILGSPVQTDVRCIEICKRLGIIVLSADYRLAPEDPYPAALHDCYAALAYLHNSADRLDVDRTLIGVGGESAGGGLAASLAIFARDRREYAICHQQLIFPMIDDRTGNPSIEIDPNLGEFAWTGTNNQYGWTSYLGDVAPQNAHIPARTENLSGLPPVWIAVGDLDLFFPENKVYAERLSGAGVSASLTVYPGAPHGFYLAPEGAISRKFNADFLRALGRGLNIAEIA